MKSIWQTIRAIPNWIVLMLDWVVGVAERLVVIGVACVIFYIGWCFFGGRVDQQLQQDVKTFSESWRVLLLLLIPLFYRAVRAFLERVEEFGGMKAPFKTKSTDPTKQIGE